MIVLIPMYGNGTAWYEPVDLDNPPEWVRRYGYITIGCENGTDTNTNKNNTTGARSLEFHPPQRPEEGRKAETGIGND